MAQPTDHNEVVAFLGIQPPHDRLDAEDVERLASAASAETFPKGATVVEVDGPQYITCTSCVRAPWNSATAAAPSTYSPLATRSDTSPCCPDFPAAASPSQ